MLKSDVEDVADAYVMASSLSSSTDSEAVRKVVTSSRQHMWSKVYKSVDKKDSGAIKMIVEIVSIPASLSKMQKKAISRPIWKHHESQGTRPPHDLLQALESVVDGINKSLATLQDGFLDCVTRFANANTAQELQAVAEKDDLVKNLTSLLLSPAEDFNVAAQTLISQAYDVDGRVE